MFNRKATLALLALAGVVGAVELVRRPGVQRVLRKTVHEALVAADLAAINERLGIYRDSASSPVRPTAEDLWGHYDKDEDLDDEEEDEEEAELNEEQERRASEEAFERYLAAMEKAQRAGRRRVVKPTAEPATPEPAEPVKAVRKTRTRRDLPSAGIVVGSPDPGSAPVRKTRTRRDLPSAGIVVGSPDPGPVPVRKTRTRKTAEPET